MTSEARKLTAEGQRLISYKAQIAIFKGGGRGYGSNFQLLMQSPNLLKSQRSITVKGGGEGARIQLSCPDKIMKHNIFPETFQWALICCSGTLMIFHPWVTFVQPMTSIIKGKRQLII